MSHHLPELGHLFWQFELCGIPLLPHIATSGQVGEVAGEFWLKVWGERLLFCAAQAPERVFATTTPCLPSHDPIAFWREQVKQGNYGRLELRGHQLGNAEETETSFLFILQQDGTRWMREWCGGDWQQLEKLPPSPFPVWHPDWQTQENAFVIPDEVLKQLCKRPFPASERQEYPLVWLRGSRAQWKRYDQARETAFFATSSQPWHSGTGDRIEREYLEACTPFDGLPSHLPIDYVGLELTPWDKLGQRHFVCIGWRWSPRKNKDLALREGWKVSPRSQSVTIRVTTNPSQHERMEALLFLREWLRGKVPDDEIPSFLS